MQSAQSSQDALRDATLDAHHTLLHELASSEMLELPAGVAYIHRSSAVLLRGTLKTSGRRYIEGGRKGVSAGRELGFGSLDRVTRLSGSSEVLYAPDLEDYLVQLCKKGSARLITWRFIGS